MKRQIKIHLFQTNPEYEIIYNDLLKQGGFWRSSGQYFMARECFRKASLLLNENLSEINKVTPTEQLYCPTKKLNNNNVLPK